MSPAGVNRMARALLIASASMQRNRLPKSRHLFKYSMDALLDLIPGARPASGVSVSVLEGPVVTCVFAYYGADLGPSEGLPNETAAADEDIFFMGTWSYRKGEWAAADTLAFDLAHWVCPAARAPRRVI